MKNWYELIWKGFSLLLVLLLNTGGAQAVPASASGTVFFLAGLGLEEINEHTAPFLNHLMHKGALGLVSSRQRLEPTRGTYVFSAPAKSDLFPGAPKQVIETTNALLPLPLPLEDELLKAIQCEEGPLTVVHLEGPRLLAAVRPLISMEDFNRARRLIIAHFDGILAAAYNLAPPTPENLFVILVTEPDPVSWQAGRRLGWAVFSGGGYDGLLYSQSTRRPGLVTLLDVETALSGMSTSTAGRILGSVGQMGNIVGDIIDLLEKAGDQYRHRVAFIQSFVGIQVACVFLTILALARGLDSYIYASLQHVHGIMVAWPLIILLIPGYWSPVFVVFSSLIAAAVIYGVFGFLFPGQMRSVSAIFVFVCLGFWLALIFADPLFSRSSLGYSAVVGARFYGIGNEFVGFFIGAGILALIFLAENKRHTKIILPLGIGTICAGVGLTWLGANFGGFVTCFVIGVMLMWLCRFSAGWLVFLGATGISAVLVLDFISAQPSHLGLLLQEIFTGNGGYLAGVVSRKATMNLSLWGVTPWTRIFILFFLSVVMALRHPGGFYKKVGRTRPLLYRGFSALFCGAFIAILVNDSGVVAGATTLYYPAHLLFMMLLEEKKEYIEMDGHKDGYK